MNFSFNDHSLNFQQPSFFNKITEPDALVQKIKTIRTNTAKPIKIAFTNGCFDILHCGHATYLAQIKQISDYLIVGVNTDESILRLNKSMNDIRPINQLYHRELLLASLHAVDFVTYFKEDTPLNLIQLLDPDILVKGGDWNVHDIVGSEYVEGYGGLVLSIPFIFETSTTSIIKKIMTSSDSCI